MKRIAELDAIRGLTAMVIILHHLGYVGDSIWVLTTVDLFFVISGYFITTNVLAKSNSSNFFRVFYARRALRTWPAYYATLAMAALIGQFVPRLGWIEPWPYYLTFTQHVPSYWTREVPAVTALIHTWTLAIEEQFYLLWPLALVAVGRRWLVPLLATMLAVSLGLRSQGFWPYLLLTRWDGLVVGSFVAWLASDHGRWGRHRQAIRAGFMATASAGVLLPTWPARAAVAIAPFWPGAPWMELVSSSETLRCTIVFGALVGLILCDHGRPWLAPLRDRRLCYLGDVSYPLYLFHPLVLVTIKHVCERLGLAEGWWTGPTIIAFSFALAELSNRFLERPLTRLKGRLRYESIRPPAGRVDRGDRVVAPGPHLAPVSQPAAVPSD